MRIIRLFRHAVRRKDGQVAVAAVFLVPALFAMLGLVVNMSYMVNEKIKLQTISDACAFSGAVAQHRGVNWVGEANHTLWKMVRDWANVMGSWHRGYITQVNPAWDPSLAINWIQNSINNMKLEGINAKQYIRNKNHEWARKAPDLAEKVYRTNKDLLGERYTSDYDLQAKFLIPSEYRNELCNLRSYYQNIQFYYKQYYYTSRGRLRWRWQWAQSSFDICFYDHNDKGNHAIFGTEIKKSANKFLNDIPMKLPGTLSARSQLQEYFYAHAAAKPHDGSIGPVSRVGYLINLVPFRTEGKLSGFIDPDFWRDIRH